MVNNVRIKGVGFHASVVIYGFLRAFLLLAAWFGPRIIPGVSGNIPQTFTIIGVCLSFFVIASFAYGQFYLKPWVEEVYGDYINISNLNYMDMAFFHFFSLKNNKGYSIRFGRNRSKFRILLTPDDSTWLLLDRNGRTFELLEDAEMRLFQYHFEGMADKPRADDSFYVLGDEDGDPHIFTRGGMGMVVLIADSEIGFQMREKGYILLECPRVRLNEMCAELHKRELFIQLIGPHGAKIYTGERLNHNRENQFFID